MSEIDKPSDQIERQSRQWLEVVLSLNDGPQRLQEAIAATVGQEARSVDEALGLIGLAHAAITVSGQDITFASWFRDQSQRLLSRAADGLARIEAARERTSTALN